ncbi:MAG: 50S ribosomal protein L15 [Pseudomonadota bacterium]
MKLSDLRDNPGATKNKRRLGRGIGSGRGKTAGRGVKGQKSRSGVAINGYEGGQMPIHMRLPKRGFNNPFAKRLNIVSVGRLQQAVDAGKLDAGATITVAEMVSAGVLRRAKDGVRVLSDGAVTSPLKLSVWGASKSAISAIEAAGGSVEVLAPTKPQAAAS